MKGPLRPESSLGSRHRKPGRGGTMLVVVMVCLAVVSMLTLSLVRSVIQSQRQQVREERIAQTEWLAQAGLDRAAMRLALAPDYTGEYWEIEPGESGFEFPARIEIRVTPATDGDTRQVVHVVATYPSNTEQTCRRSRAARLSTPAKPVELKE